MTPTTWSREKVTNDGSLTVENLAELARIPFQEAPFALWRRVYGVPYVQLDDAKGGRLWVTRHGWRHLRHLDPSQWYFERRYDRQGERLSRGTGAVYRVTSHDSSGRPLALVVKFSRMAQDIPVHVSSQFPGSVPRHVVDSAVFNDPFQEFGVLERLREGRLGPPELRILTKRPLAVYSPGRRFEPWQLGRTEGCFRRHQRQLQQDQTGRPPGMSPVELCIQRQYIYLFHWTRGQDGEDLVRRGLLSAADAAALVEQVVEDLAAKGFRVLDTKPNHIILRQRRDGQLLRRDGKLVYALVDFELLQPIDPSES
jgi:hypothetical protein